MTCRELVEFLTEHVAHALPADQRAVFERHLIDCEDCRHYLSSFQATIRLSRGAFCGSDDGIPADVPEALVVAVLSARRAMT